MNTFPNDRSVLLLDNASIHHAEEAQEICTNFGVVLEFLPAYSPQFTPITIFTTLKAGYAGIGIG
jgi:transposase